MPGHVAPEGFRDCGDGARGAAELLGIHPTTLASWLRALKITLPKPR